MIVCDPYLILNTEKLDTALKFKFLDLTPNELKTLNSFARIETPSDFDQKRYFFAGCGFYDRITIKNIQKKLDNSITILSALEIKPLAAQLKYYDVNPSHTLFTCLLTDDFGNFEYGKHVFSD